MSNKGLAKLLEIQKKLKAPKNQFNEYGGYKYRSCEDILEAVKPLLDGCTILLNDEVVQIGDRYYVKATATFFEVESGQFYSVEAYAREQQEKKKMDPSQITGAASSYARKYALNGLLLIDDTKDADATNKHGQEEKKGTVKEAKEPPKTKKASLAELKRQLFSMMTAKGLDKDQAKEFYTWALPSKPTAEDLAQFIANFEEVYTGWQETKNVEEDDGIPD